MNGKPLLKDKDKPRKQRVKTKTQLRKILDTIFSQFIRLSHADIDGNCVCYTCGTVLHWKKIQNGHLVSRWYTLTRYDERNCRPQCYVCNLIRNGRTPEFAEKLEIELGQGIVAELYKLARGTAIDFPYQVKIDEYKIKLAKLGERATI